MRSIIAISGPHGSGKSTIAKKLAKELNMNYISAGQVFRQMAKERDISLKEFSSIAKKDSEIDKLIDDRTLELGQNDNTIVDAQLAVYFTPKDILLKLYINASPEVRWQRIAHRDEVSLDYAKKETEIRETTEAERFKLFYDIDITDLSQYDVIINTDRMSKEEVYELAKAIIIQRKNFFNL